MIHITQNSTNTLILQLNDSVSYTNPYFIFNWVDIYNRSVCFSLTNVSGTSAYNKFIYTDGSENQLYASGTVYVYESAVDASVINLGTMNLLRTEQYRYAMAPSEEHVYDVSVLQRSKYVYNPIWLTGEIPSIGIPANKITQDETHRFVSDAFLGNVSSGAYATNSSVNTALSPIKYAGFTVCNSINYVVDASDSLGVIDASGYMSVILPNSLTIGFQTTIINSGVEVITLEASTLYSMDGSTKISDQYAAASVIHKGSGVWYALGFLKSS